MTHIDLKDKTILLTGASDGIGRGVADYLMQMGGKVAVHYNSNKDAAQQLVDTHQNGSKVFQADLSNETEVFQLFKKVTSVFKKIDVVILNAGVFLPHSTAMNCEDWLTIWKKTMAINLDAVGLLTKLGLDHFKMQGEGRFIYIGSRAVFRGETEEYLHTRHQKVGSPRWRVAWPLVWKTEYQILCGFPGFTRTKMAEAFIDSYGEEKVLDEIALNDLTEPKDLAPMIALMCSGLMIMPREPPLMLTQEAIYDNDENTQNFLWYAFNFRAEL